MSRRQDGTVKTSENIVGASGVGRAEQETFVRKKSSSKQAQRRFLNLEENIAYT